MAENKKDQTVEEKEVNENPATTATEPLRMCKGQMPAPLVWYIRFHEVAENASALARKYFTTPGKIVDIQKSNNQKYIVENMKWSEKDIEAAAEQVKANFVRGQEHTPGTINIRSLATTEAGDEQYSLEALDKISEMVFSDDALSLDEARAIHLKENPRASRAATTTSEPAKSKTKAEPEVEEETIDDDDMDGLLD